MTENLIKQKIHWVGTDDQLEQLVENLSEKKFLALDTEFIRTDTYYPIAGLIQLNDGDANYLIDPKSITDFFPLADLFDRDDLIIAMHSCSEDLEVFQHTVGCIPKTILDTQVACALVGYGFSIGYGKAVAIGLGHDLPKAETRSDWLRRPLSEAQLKYAALDVEYLYQLTEKLIDLLHGCERWNWILEEGEKIKQNYLKNQNSDKTYLRIKSAWKLNRSELAVLRSLAKWREEKAQIRNIPRNRIVKEHALLELAKKYVKQLSELREIEGITERMIKNDGETLINIINEARSLSDSDLPELLPPPLSAPQNRQLKVLRAEVQGIAEEYDLPVEILVKKKEYEQMLHQKYNAETIVQPSNFSGWRQLVVGHYLMERISNLNTDG